MIAIRTMAPADLARLGEIDRSEHITREYRYRHGALVAHAVDIAAPAWSTEGDHADSITGHINAWRPVLDHGGTLLGAFDSDRLVGLAIYQPNLEPAVGKLAVLHVSRPYRHRGVGSQLMETVVRLAEADRARGLYVSATPTGPTVDFYLRHRFEPTDTPSATLFAREPLDIHMVRVLRPSAVGEPIR